MIEYKKVTMLTPPTEKDLNMLGAENWDMCGMMDNNFFFKREAKPKDLGKTDKTIHPSPARNKKK